MMGWIIAGILYFLPIAISIRDLDYEVDEVKDAMRENGFWYPSMALWIAIGTIAIWPLLMLFELITGGRE